MTKLISIISLNPYKKIEKLNSLIDQIIGKNPSINDVKKKHIKRHSLLKSNKIKKVTTQESLIAINKIAKKFELKKAIKRLMNIHIGPSWRKNKDSNLL